MIFKSEESQREFARTAIQAMLQQTGMMFTTWEEMWEEIRELVGEEFTLNSNIFPMQEIFIDE